MIRIYFAITLICMLATPSGGGPVTVYNDHRTRIHAHELHGPQIPSTHSVSIWSVASHRRRLVMRWTCTPFEPVDADGENCDASMWLRPAVPGHKQIAVIKPFDRTDVSAGRSRAHVLAKSAHPGVTRMRLTVGVEDRFSPAGQYCTTVNLSVTAL